MYLKSVYCVRAVAGAKQLEKAYNCHGTICRWYQPLIGGHVLVFCILLLLDVFCEPYTIQNQLGEGLLCILCLCIVSEPQQERNSSKRHIIAMAPFVGGTSPKLEAIFLYFVSCRCWTCFVSPTPTKFGWGKVYYVFGAYVSYQSHIRSRTAQKGI